LQIRINIASAKRLPHIKIGKRVTTKVLKMTEFTPVLLSPVWISSDTVAPWMAVLVYAFLAGLPRLLAWILDPPRR
jgi:hypothetical protein